MRWASMTAVKSIMENLGTMKIAIRWGRRAGVARNIGPQCNKGDACVRILLLAVGKAKTGPARALFEDYAQRLRPPLELIEVEERRRLGAAEMKRREAELLRAQLARRATRPLVVALDERGRSMDTVAFARQLARWREGGAAEVAFLIGGADGLDADLAKGADLQLALGSMTWPHLLVRGLIAEQLYRAQQIQAGHPYHRV
jgi:23S rRNA (pseudouridine1915-N3)-methyltransferase